MKDKTTKIKRHLRMISAENIAVIMLVILLTILKPIMIIPGLCLIAVLAALEVSRRKYDRRAAYSEFFEDVATEMDETIASSVIFNPFPLCMIDSQGKILWCNQKFHELFPDNENIEDTNIYDLTGVKLHELTNEELKDKTVSIPSISRSFRVQFAETELTDADEDGAHTMRMLHWMENTASEALKKAYREERLCIAYINVDNLDDILVHAPDEKKASLAGDLEKAIRQWGTRCQGAIVRQSKAKFVLLLDSRMLDNCEANKFPILDEVRAIPTGTDIPVSLSIGVGALGKTFAATEEHAAAALDLALGRGGDQAVVKKGSNVEFYGGKLMTVEKRNKGKSRIVALALRQLIDQAPRVFVMGHKLPDMDSLGSALGIARMAKNRGKEVNIVIDTWDAVEMLYELAHEEGEYRFISGEYAKLIASADDLLIIVDTHKPSLIECVDLTEIMEKIVIIDHHRRGESMVANPTLIHIEPYASSTSELVAEMLQYVSSEKKGISNIEAEGLLAGISVDTKNFSVKAGVRTFEAATWLRRQGADTMLVRQFFQTDMNLFKEKAMIISRAKKLHDDMALSYAEGPKKNISVLISMAADELLDIRGMKASFVIGESVDGGLRVSARSLGDVNVQRIMEKIGGGGNLTSAGAQLDMPLMEALDMLEKVLMDYITDEKEIELARKEKEKEKDRERKVKDRQAEKPVEPA